MEDKLIQNVIDLLISQHEKLKEPRNLAEEIKAWLETIREKIVSSAADSDCETSELTRNRINEVCPEVEPLVDVRLSFNDPRIKAKLEELMGTNVVRLTDRNYMLQLRARLLDEYEQNLRKRMKERERDEVEREKRLILSGRMPIEDAPAELEDHPVFRITQFTRKILQEKREKAMKRQTFKCKAVPVDVLVDKKINSTVGTERSKTHSNDEELRLGSCETLDKVDGPGITSSEDRRSVVIEEMAPGFMFTQEEYDNLKYEAPLVKQLRTIQDIEEMYKLADSIVGPYTLYKKPKQHQYSGS